MSETQMPYRLLAPGPVPVPPLVLKAMSEKVIHHRTPEFEKILRSAWSGLKVVFATTQPVQILAGTGSAAMEAAVVNSLSPGNEALVIITGKFGERWADMCERYGVKVHRWSIPWGEVLPLAEFEAQIKKFPQVKVVFTQACETSTATMHPIREMSAIVHKNSSALFAVDAITAVGCFPLPMDEWQLDIVVGGSQKAFMIPTGLAFIALSERAWKAQAAAKCPKYYFDLAMEKAANARGETLFSTPTPLIVGLNVVLERLQKVGFEQVRKRCEVLARATRSCGEIVGLKVFSKAPSTSVTALLTPQGQSSAELRDWLEAKRGITVMGGQDQLKGKILRIGHMGDIRDEDMLALFQSLCEKLGQQSKWPKIESELKQQLVEVAPLFP